jgi:hypothetical protein
MAKLVLLPDTNFFIQCKPPSDLDWTVLGRFDEIEIVVPRIVQREIDKHKNRGNDRVANRSRTTSARFKEMILGDGEWEVRSTGPKVTIRLDTSALPDPANHPELNMEQPDDALVASASAFAIQNTNLDVKLLTHDSGPMLSAKAIGLPFISIPDGWFLQPEPDDREKRIRQLELAVDRLSSQGPQFRALFSDSSETQIETLNVRLAYFPPLPPHDVSVLMLKIKEQCPIATAFDQNSQSHPLLRQFVASRLVRETYTPATDQEIEKYKDQTYPDWLATCERRLKKLHLALELQQGRPCFNFLATNSGSAPAADVLLSFKSEGPVSVLAPPYISDDDEEKEVDDHGGNLLASLPLPPSPPQGVWSTKRLPFGIADFGTDDWRFGGQALGRALDTMPYLRDSYRPTSERDPNTFYYKDRPSKPVNRFELTCAQWRHGQEDESFICVIHSEAKEGEIRGAIRVVIEAENLKVPFERVLPVSVYREKKSTLEVAERLIASLGKL